MRNGTDPRRPIPFQAPGQGNNPNIAPTRPQAMNPLTLVGSWLAMQLEEKHPALNNASEGRPRKVDTSGDIRGTVLYPIAEIATSDAIYRQLFRRIPGYI